MKKIRFAVQVIGFILASTTVSALIWAWIIAASVPSNWLEIAR